MEDSVQHSDLISFRSKGKHPQPLPYYTYKPLSTGWIRLLQIHHGNCEEYKSDTSFSSTISVSLTEHALSSCPKYTALSYTWGSATHEPDPRYATFTTEPRCFPVICEGKLLRSTRNLRDALRRIREVQSKRKPDEHPEGGGVESSLRPSYFLWIDALCIDQDDLHEYVRR